MDEEYKNLVNSDVDSMRVFQLAMDFAIGHNYEKEQTFYYRGRLFAVIKIVPKSE
jgi:hypothetical protein